MPIDYVAPVNWVTNQVTIGVTPTLLVAAHPNRVELLITQIGATPIFLGGSGVTTANGAYLAGVVGAVKSIPTQAAVYGIVALGSQVVSVEEIF